jgi:hypothetical protein
LRAWLKQLDPGSATALLCGTLALLLASIPPVAFLTKFLALLGLLTGLVAAVVVGLSDPVRAAVPLVAAVPGLVVLLFVGSWPEGSPPPPPPLVSISLKEGGLVPHTPISEEDWVSAATHAIRKKDVRVQVLSAKIGAVEVEYGGKKVSSREKFLILTLGVGLEAVDFQQIPYETWADQLNQPSKNPPALTDNLNQTYPQKKLALDRKIVARDVRGQLTPGRPVREVLLFPVPSAKMETLRLQLPASAFGDTGEIRFEIPRSMIEGP